MAPLFGVGSSLCCVNVYFGVETRWLMVSSVETSPIVLCYLCSPKRMAIMLQFDPPPDRTWVADTMCGLFAHSSFDVPSLFPSLCSNKPDGYMYIQVSLG